jgi:hypothetical protein
MKNTLKILMILLAFSLGLSSCRSLDPSTLNPKGQLGNLLPSLIPEYHVASFGSIFPISQLVEIGRSTTIGSGVISNTTGATSANPIHNDIDVIFEHDVENISNRNGTVKGIIKCRAIDGMAQPTGDGWRLLSIFTLGTINLLGVPVRSYKTVLGIEVSIYDINNNRIGRYTSNFYNNTAYAALYWGYSEKDLPRKTARSAFTSCMNDIKNQIAKDYNRLSQALQ